jgi:hypothetical protein
MRHSLRQTMAVSLMTLSCLTSELPLTFSSSQIALVQRVRCLAQMAVRSAWNLGLIHQGIQTKNTRTRHMKITSKV